MEEDVGTGIGRFLVVTFRVEGIEFIWVFIGISDSENSEQ